MSGLQQVDTSSINKYLQYLQATLKHRCRCDIHPAFRSLYPALTGQEWSYLRGGLTTLDRDYGIFNKIHHDIGTHVVHHLFPQIPHYNLEEATEAVKPVMGPYYREPTKSKSW